MTFARTRQSPALASPNEANGCHDIEMHLYSEHLVVPPAGLEPAWVAYLATASIRI